MPVGPQTPVVAPPAGPPRFGLIVSANQPDDGAARWENGFAYQPEGCVPGQTIYPCGGSTLSDPTTQAQVAWIPYALTFREKCSTFGFEARDWEGRVTRGLQADAERQLGAELWKGTVAQANALPNFYFAKVGTTDLTAGTPIDTVLAFDYLEEYLATHNGGQQGMIHCTASALSVLAATQLLSVQGSRIVSKLGTVVVCSPGYDGSSPSGTVPASSQWMYATDMVDVRLSRVQTFPFDVATVDRTTNTGIVQAEQVACASWQECRLAGAETTLKLVGQ